MFLNLGLTADAAAIHRHEFSTEQGERPSPPTLSQVSNSILSLGFMSAGRRTLSPISGNKAANPVHAAPVSLASPLSSPLASPRSSIEAEREQDDLQSGSRSELEQEIPITPPKRRTFRSKTSFRFAHPPPSAHKRLRIRPRLLLQLQHVSQTSRPIAALDVIPSSLFRTRPTRKVSGACRGKERIGPNDLVIIENDSYGPLEDEERSSSDIQRDVVAIINHPRKEDPKAKGMVDICMAKGGVWEATSISSSVYEFSHTGEDGLRKSVRWVMRGKGNRHSTGSMGQVEQENKRLSFSVMDPTKRRHPVIAWLTRNGIEVLDQYSPTSGSIRSRATSISSPVSIAAGQDRKHSNALSEPDMVETDDQLRTLIVVTGIWVALREGWSSYPLPPEPRHSIPRSLSSTNPSALQLQAPDMDGNGVHLEPAEYANNRHGLPPVWERPRQASVRVSGRSASPAPEFSERTQRQNGSLGSDNAASRPKSRPRKRRGVLCLGCRRGRDTPTSPDIATHPDLSMRSPTSRVNRRPATRDMAEREITEADAGHPSEPSNRSTPPAQKGTGSTKRRKWCGIAFWIDSMSIKTKKKAR